ncbi:MAG TPA: glycosyltransferase family 2 protein [Candidatus Jeotgalibaca pullicola]|nr:glycosyltransferase family 2 protein [Candidatus Jeotgalibaca pullicola]
MKKVSIIMPVYNMADRIIASVEALLEQTYPFVEIIIVDDGSTDKSYTECLLFAKEHENVKVYHTENQGAGPARNYGITVATGDYAYFPDADDLLEKNAIKRLVEAMNDQQGDLIIFGFQTIGKNGNVTSTRKYSKNVISGSLVRGNYEHFLSIHKPFWIQGAPWNKFFDLHLIKERSIIFPPLRRHQDEVFISRYVQHVHQVRFISDVLYTYHTNDVRKEWEKYPTNYLDIAMDLKKYREEIITEWNPNNSAVKEIIEREYIFNVTKGFELSFSKKMGLNRKKRKEWLTQMVEKTKMENLNIPHTPSMKYQAKVLTLIKSNKQNQLYYLLLLKVFVQKNMYPLFSILKQ